MPHSSEFLLVIIFNKCVHSRSSPLALERKRKIGESLTFFLLVKATFWVIFLLMMFLKILERRVRLMVNFQKV